MPPAHGPELDVQGRGPGHRRRGLVDALARWRVRIGFWAALVALVFARPTWESWRVGLLLALGGEAIRVWAAGHLEKSREVTRSGPYEYVRHPLYVGSAVMAIGVVVAARSLVVAVVVAAYMSVTIAAAIRVEESFLDRAFGDTYARYRASRTGEMKRRFSLERAMRNREYRAALGMALGFALLALQLLLPI